jgi:hypothetical protein
MKRRTGRCEFIGHRAHTRRRHCADGFGATAWASVAENISQHTDMRQVDANHIGTWLSRLWHIRPLGLLSEM